MLMIFFYAPAMLFFLQFLQCDKPLSLKTFTYAGSSAWKITHKHITILMHLLSSISEIESYFSKKPFHIFLHRMDRKAESSSVKFRGLDFTLGHLHLWEEFQ